MTAARACYVAWVRQTARSGWVDVALAPTLQAADKLLMKWIGEQSRPPLASAVLPAGQHPVRPSDD